MPPQSIVPTSMAPVSHATQAYLSNHMIHLFESAVHAVGCLRGKISTKAMPRSTATAVPLFILLGPEQHEDVPILENIMNAFPAEKLGPETLGPDRSELWTTRLILPRGSVSTCASAGSSASPRRKI